MIRLLQTIDPEVPTTPWPLLLFGVVLLIAVYGIYAVAKARIQFVGLPERQRIHAKALRQSRSEQSPITVRWRPDDALADRAAVRDRLRAALQAADPDDLESEYVPADKAARTVARTLREEWADATENIPQTAVRLGALAVVNLLFGLVAVVPLSTWRGTTDGGVSVSVADVVAEVSGLTAGVVEALSTVLFAVPVVGTVWRAVQVVVIVGGTALYQHPVVLVAVLVLLAGTIVVLDRRLSLDADHESEPRSWPILLTGAILMAWIAGLAPAALGAVVQVPQIGALVGAVLSVVVFGYLAFDIAREAGLGFVTDMEALADDDPFQAVVGFEVALRLGSVLVGLALPLATLYVIVAVATGKLLGVLAILASARALVQIAVAGLILVTVGTLAWISRDELAVLRRALADVAAERRVRFLLFAQGLPAAGIGLTGLALWSLDLPLIAAVGAAVLVGVGLTILGRILYRAKYRVELRDSDRERATRRVVAHVYELADADGATHDLISVDGTDYAHPDRDTLLDVAVDAVQADAAREETAETLAEHHARHVTDLGIVCLDADHAKRLGRPGAPTTVQKLRAQVRRTVFGTLENNDGRVRAATLDDKLSDYPDAIVDPALTHYRTHGTSEGLVLRRDGYYRLSR